VAVLIAVALALGIATHSRNEIYRSTVSLWQDVLTKSPHNSRAHQNLAVAYLRTGDFVRALDESRIAAELYPESPDSHFNVAEALMQLNRPNEALSELGTTLQRDPEFWKGYYRRAEIFVKRDDFAQAADDFDRAAKACPDPAGSADAWLECGRCRMRQNRPDQAVEALLKAIACQPEVAEAWYELGRAQGKLRHFDQALESFDRALELQPGMAECYLSRGAVYGQQGRHESAARDLSRAIELQPGLTGAYSNRAVAFYHLQEFSRARADLQVFEERTGERHFLHERLRESQAN
jgi:tetratricopeptide (TPR) repeat protein